MTGYDPAGQRDDQQDESLEQFIERAARTQLANMRCEWDTMQRDVRQLRAMASDLISRCDLILTGKPYIPADGGF